MTMADVMLETAASEYVLVKEKPEYLPLSVDAIYNQVLGLHRYAKGLEFALAQNCCKNETQNRLD